MTITRNSEHIKVAEHTGKWYCIDEYETGGQRFFLLEHETYGDETEHIVVDETGFKIFGEMYDGDWTEEVDDWLINGDEEGTIMKDVEIKANARALQPELELIVASANAGKMSLSQLCGKLGGHNLDERLFDFNYKCICATVVIDDETGDMRLSEGYEVYDEDGCHIADEEWEEEAQ
ncbi:MAG: hypothetical protein LBN43_04220 [Oscillospiraceae bacterium]|jgi:hypothetical protein|nr:hypothetical protein [Oscillospiraceae bacterium]